ncbi:TRAP transporter small permease [Alteribacillus bidgolensis]|uniref:TRAP-type C4-dicarboxylate transport system, small permease component n=1 Tax=Alteribacillus bidgolensis TaxID=930129 RepID=A0A1G8H0V3_9BACI|nr:TRAP transporter small permease [Alteribacillus bidgolensis]SDI00120.1 TRAP-type C4-dicarboxylate transport system, small permease component [Alteribacillus bidgolensis]
MEKVFNKGVRVVLVSLFSIITLLAVLQIFTRFFGFPMSWPNEAMRFLFIWFVMLGSAYALREKKHIVVDFIGDSVPRKVTRIIDILVNVTILIFIGILIKYGFQVVEVTSIQTSSVLRISMGYVFLSVPIGGILMLLYTVLNIIDLVKEKGVSS